MNVEQVRRRGLMAGAALVLGFVGASPALAQYRYGYGGDDDDYRPRRYERRYERRDDDYDRGYDRPPPPRYGRRGSICVTARGNCRYPPAPFNSPCSCDVPGFGEKRGAIGN